MKDCNQCGKCCIKYGDGCIKYGDGCIKYGDGCIKYGDGALSATKEEIDLWELFNPEIFKFVKNNDIWFDPESGVKLNSCPFLEVSAKKDSLAPNIYTCNIYLDRPEDCRHYPSLIAEMIEAIDLEKTKQAQIKLDILMKDSRPSIFP